MMRCPQIGMLEQYTTDFIIVKESFEQPCQVIASCIPDQFKKNLQYSTTLKNPSLPFLDETYHKGTSLDSISHDADSIDWNRYNIVLTVNACIPNRIIEKYPNVLWCYYVGENDGRIDTLLGKYDVILNQDVMRKNLPPYSIGFPYTYIGPQTIETINTLHLGNDPHKHGIFMEINNTQERPVKTVPNEFLEISNRTQHPIIVHNQNILENTKNIYRAKYFVKLFGRGIRGNSVLETISAGTLLLANRRLITYSDLILVKCHVETKEDVISKIQYYDEHPDEYATLIRLQRALMEKYYFKGPVKQLITKYTEKIHASKNTIDYKYTALIIEPRKHTAFSFVLNNFMTYLSDEWKFIIVHGNTNKEYVSNIMDTELPHYKHKILSYIQLPTDNLTAEEYSNILKDPGFYENIHTDIFLIFQTDSIILKEHKELINQFLQYDYVGAPWVFNQQVGNGGLSLRKKSKMLEIIHNVPNNSHLEDIYFIYQNRVPLYKPPFELAKLFSIETTFHPYSFGVHKLWAHLKKDDFEYLKHKYDDIRILEELNRA